ncbi:MAG: glycosyltransferase family 2 protein [Desulfuromonadales bacterium]|nr:MAG: glycosyltransferase family 2 protein [Desulfuromonadales bacterium]
MTMVTVAICTYNRAGNLPALIRELRAQESPIPFGILVVNNNSTDGTEHVLADLATEEGAPLRFVTEKNQGIVQARNRAIEESLSSTYLAFIDDDELPAQGWLRAAVDSLEREEAECVGGEIRVKLPDSRRPAWLADEILPFLGEVKNGPHPFWIVDRTTPVWSGNIAYRTSLFQEGLRFDRRYNREGHVVGGGEDAKMFQVLLAQEARIRYRPDMVIDHLVEDWRLRRGYFLRLHYAAGWKKGRWDAASYERTVCGVPPFMVRQALQLLLQAVPKLIFSRPDALRQAMNGVHGIGMALGTFRRWLGGAGTNRVISPQ